VCIVVLAVGLLWPPAAPAATLSMDGMGYAYTAAPGEANMLDVRLDGTAIVFTETGAAITIFPAGCAARGPGVVACQGTFDEASSTPVRAGLGDGNDRGTLDLPTFAVIDAGDGDDALTLATVTPPREPVEGLGGPGEDVLVAAGGPVLLRGGDGNDRLTASAGGAQLNGDAGEDVLTGSLGDDFLNGGEGADVIQGGDGDDWLQGAGHFGPDGAGDVLDAGPGNDRVSGNAGDDAVSGGPGNDLVNGDGGADRLAGGDGDDKLDGGAGNDRATGNPGNDSVSGGDGNDRIAGGAGDDSLLGDEDDDTLTMGPGRDRADAGAGDDRIAASDGVAAALECGIGEDAAAPDSRDRVHLDCETIEQQVACPRRWRRRCRVTGTLTGGRRAQCSVAALSACPPAGGGRCGSRCPPKVKPPCGAPAGSTSGWTWL
jgi:hypothetical protein